MIRKISAAALLLSLAACGGNEPAQDEATPAATGDAPTVAAADVPAAAGETTFKKCIACHTIDKGGPNGIGPNLFGVAGRAIGSVDGFAYSAALKAKGGVWDDAALSGYIESPVKWAPGNKMAFAGIRNEADRNALIEYLKAQK